MTKKIEMIFTCDQDWEQMTLTSNGRHCELCKKTVHDFTAKSNEEITKSGNGELCGMFLAEQIETDLVPIRIPTSLKAAVLTAGTVLGLELTEVHGQDISKKDVIEVVDKDLSVTDTTKLPQVTPQVDRNATGTDDCKNTKVRRPGKKLYFSKSFPFIKRRHVYTRGRFRY